MAELIVALDYTDPMDALSMADSLRGSSCWVKVGLELFTSEGPRIIQTLKGMGFKVMLDLKLFDIPNTVSGGVRAAALLEVDLITVHLLGGERMIRAARTVLDAENHGSKPLLFGVTVLTSMDQGELPGYTENLGDFALSLAQHGATWGLDGVVCSGNELKAIKTCCPTLQCLTPGIRPADAASDDQRRTVTPAQAVALGSDFLVVGRPITKAKDPAGAARAIIESMGSK